MKRMAVLILVTGGLLFPAHGQEGIGEGGLRLIERSVELTIDENVAWATISIRVKNPTSRVLEGEVTFDVPEGAAVCDATLSRHLASTERRAKLLSPIEATALYDAVKTPELQRIDGSTFSRAIDRAVSVRTVNERISDPAGLSSSIRPVAAETPVNVFKDPVEEQPTGGKDPALLEKVEGDRYRLRFYPVPAYDEQTVTFSWAVEVRSGINVPLSLTHRFEISDKTVQGFRFAISSSQALRSLKSGTHAGSISLVRGMRGLRMNLPLTASDRSFNLEVQRDPSATSHSCAAAAATDFTEDGMNLRNALAAIRSRTGRVVSSTASLLVIERWEADAIRRTQTEAQTGVGLGMEKVREVLSGLPAGAGRCDEVCRLLGKGGVSENEICRVVTGKTSSHDRIQWLVRNNIVTTDSRELPGFVRYAYIRHRPDCIVTELRPSELARLVASTR